MAVNMKELIFGDILILQRIDKDTVVERFGSRINASFFEAANLLGTLKLKGFVDIVSSPGLSKVSITEEGKAVLEMAQRKAREVFDALDLSVLKAVAKGAKDATGVEEMLNIRSSDLAFRLNKLLVQGFIDYDMRRSRVSVALTAEGFKRAGAAEAPTAPVPVAPEAQGAKPAGPFSPLKRLREITKRQRAPTIMDELAPSEEAETGLKPTPEELTHRRRASKLQYYKEMWGKKIAIAAIALFILLMVCIYIFVFGG